MKIAIGIITVSDRSYQGVREDLSGPVLEELVSKAGWEVGKRTILPDEVVNIRNKLVEWADSDELDVILTTGGTGFAPRDITPEATLAIIDRLAPGIVEAARSASMNITPFAMLSRGVAGMRGRTLIVNLPGSPKAAKEHLEVISTAIPHAVKLLRDDPTSEVDHR